MIEKVIPAKSQATTYTMHRKMHKTLFLLNYHFHSNNNFYYSYYI